MSLNIVRRRANPTFYRARPSRPQHDRAYGYPVPQCTLLVQRDLLPSRASQPVDGCIRGRLVRSTAPGARMRRTFVLLSAIALAACDLAPNLFAQTIKLGEINEYKQFPAFLEPYRKGMELAIEEVNAAGGVLDRKLEIVSRDDNGVPGDAVRATEELLTREKVDLLMGTFASNVGLAVADLAKRRQVLFIAAEPLTDKIVWESGNKYTFRLRASTYMQTAMLAPEAAKLAKKRWAIVYPDYG